MSDLRVTNLKGRTAGSSPTLPDGVVVTGVATATSFSGNLTGNVTGNLTGNATGLSGTPNITVGNIIGVAATFSGVVTYEDVTNVDSIGIVTARTGVKVTAGGVDITAGGLNVTAGVSTFSAEQRVTTIAEKSVISGLGNTISLTYGGSSANVAITTNPTGNITLNVTGIPTDSSFDNHNLAFSVIVLSTGTARTCTAVNLNGVSKTIKWAGGSLASAVSGVTTTSGYTVQSFAGINTIGSASTTANYEVFGVVSGGFF